MSVTLLQPVIGSTNWGGSINTNWALLGDALNGTNLAFPLAPAYVPISPYSVAIGYAASAAPANGLIVSGNLGVGTTSPAAALDVNGNMFVRGGVINSGTSSNLDLRSDTGNSILFGNQTSGGSFGAINSGGLFVNGNLGIGNTSPNSLLTLAKNNDITLTGDDGYLAIVGGTSDGGFSPPGGKIVLSGYTRATYGGGVAIMASASGDSPNIDFYVNGSSSPALRLAQNGKVGIGVASPGALLQLAAGTSGANTAPLKFTSGTKLAAEEDGAMEYDGTHLYFTIGSTRITIV